MQSNGQRAHNNRNPTGGLNMKALKAHVAAAVAGLGSLVTGLADDKLKAVEVVIALTAALVAWQGTYWADNKE